MKMLHTKVNIVPVIAKADCLTKFEVQRLKRKVSGMNQYVLLNKLHHTHTHTHSLIGSYLRSVEDRCKDDITINNCFAFNLSYKTNRLYIAVGLFNLMGLVCHYCALTTF